MMKGGIEGKYHHRKSEISLQSKSKNYGEMVSRHALSISNEFSRGIYRAGNEPKECEASSRFGVERWGRTQPKNKEGRSYDLSQLRPPYPPVLAMPDVPITELATL